MSLASQIEMLKNRKSVVGQVYLNFHSNHPHRIATVSTSGALTYTIDERSFAPSPTLSASKYDFSLDFSLGDSWTRVYQSKFPWYSATPVALNQGEFCPSHVIKKPWKFDCDFGAYPNYATIGDCTRTNYTRALITDPWTAGTPVTTDVDFKFGFLLTLGGDPTSGGRGTGSDPEKALFQFSDSWSGSYTNKLPNLYADVYRLPWVDPWASESTVFSTAFSAFLTAQNTADGGGHSGTCSLSLDFT